MARRKRQKKITVLIVGEGKSDAVFLNHMKPLYAHSSFSVKIVAANGGSPDSVVQRVVNEGDYDRKFILIDEDIKVPQQCSKRCKSKNIKIIICSPQCLEGMILELLGQNIPHTSKGCKVCFTRLYGNPCRPESYKCLTKSVLDHSSAEPIIRLREAMSKTGC